MNLKDSTDLTGKLTHTCDVCQHFISKKLYLSWVKDSYIDTNGDRQFNDMLKCMDCS
jgi:hypothetical protein|tara:strand:+ start:663 stop:833 length:171 start_codon:yes stop_codon:yes gene_type:complete